jgi:hypothetical protein
MSQSSLSTLANLSLWLDARDLNYFTSYQISNDPFYDVSEWRDKSSNSYVFTPMIPNLRPVLSTNAVKFNIASSFQFMSQVRIPATSSLDLFMIVTPELIRGPRQPFFDSTDFTLAETDTRINTQVYADGGEFFRPCFTPGYTNGFQVYKGDLYAATNVGQVPNYIQRYDKVQRNFNYVREWPMSTGATRGMAVLDGKLYTASDTRCEWFNGSTAFVSTNFISSSAYCPVVYKGDFYMMSHGRIWQSATAAQRPQLYRFNQRTGRMDLLTEAQTYLQNVTNNWGMYFSNAINFRNDLYFMANDDGGNGYTSRWNGTFYLSNSVLYAQNPISVYMGNLFNPRFEARFFKWNENVPYNIGRQGITNNPGLQGIVYKGNMVLYKNMSITPANSNVMEIWSGEQGGPFSNSICQQLTTVTTQINQQPGAIVHEGRLFVNWNSSSQVIEFGNGVGMDQPFSPSAPLLLLIRKSPIITQLWFNGSMVQQEYVSFTYSNQPPREMHIGGAVGSMSSGFSDSGHDHLTGSIHSVVQYTSNLSQSDRQRVEGILAWNYGIQSVLPVNHPFKNAAP